MLGRSSFRRSTRSRCFRALLFLGALCLIDLFTLLKTRPDEFNGAKPVPDVRNHRVFIASIHWNNEKILRSNWNRAVLDLVEYFGVHNVHISIHESGSWDNSKDALMALDNELEDLGVKRTITLEQTTHADEMAKPVTTGWIDTPRGKKELRRIPYLSKLRNLALQPLNELAASGIKFDKVLFLNDVAFKVCAIHPINWSLLTPHFGRLRMLLSCLLLEMGITLPLVLWTSPSHPSTTTHLR